MIRFFQVPLLAAILCVPCALLAAALAVPARPFVELEKSRFSTKETVFFWIGLTGAGESISPNLRDTGRVIITRPDGTQKIDQAGRVDGTDQGDWRGGWGLGTEKSQVGRYSVVFEFGGQSSPPVSFVVEDIPSLNDIVANFVFPSPLDLGIPGSVTLTVRNGSKEIIRFPQRGEEITGSVSVKLNKTTEPKFTNEFPIPDSVLLASMGLKESPIVSDSFTWAQVGKVPTVTLKPGETYQLKLPLASILSAGSSVGDALKIVPGEYDLRLDTTLQVLLGEPGGPWASIVPLHLPVTATAHGTLK